MRMRIVWYRRLWRKWRPWHRDHDLTHLRMTVFAGGLTAGSECASILISAGSCFLHASRRSIAERMKDSERAFGREGEYMLVRIDSRMRLSAAEWRSVNVLSSLRFGYGLSNGSVPSGRHGDQSVSSSGSSGSESGVKPGREARLGSRPSVKLIVLSQQYALQNNRFRMSRSSGENLCAETSWSTGRCKPI